MGFIYWAEQLFKKNVSVAPMLMHQHVKPVITAITMKPSCG